MGLAIITSRICNQKNETLFTLWDTLINEKLLMGSPAISWDLDFNVYTNMHVGFFDVYKIAGINIDSLMGGSAYGENELPTGSVSAFSS